MASYATVPAADVESEATLLNSKPKTKTSLLIGGVTFGYMVSTIGALIAGMDRQAAILQQRLDAVKEYTAWRGMPRELAARVRAFYDYYYSHVPMFDETVILDGLTPQLKLEVSR